MSAKRLLVGLLIAGVGWTSGISVAQDERHALVRCPEGQSKHYFVFLATTQGHALRHGAATICLPDGEIAQSERVIRSRSADIQRRIGAESVTVINVLKLEE